MNTADSALAFPDTILLAQRTHLRAYIHQVVVETAGLPRVIGRVKIIIGPRAPTFE